MSTITKPSIESRVRSTVCTSLGLNLDALSNSARLQEDLNIDSLDIIDLSLDLEDEFTISLSEDALGGLKTVQDVINAVTTTVTAVNPSEYPTDPEPTVSVEPHTDEEIRQGVRLLKSMVTHSLQKEPNNPNGPSTRCLQCGCHWLDTQPERHLAACLFFKARAFLDRLA